jgi:hypothetical protein
VRVGQPVYDWCVPLWRGMRALMQGRFDECAECVAEVRRIGAQAGSRNAYIHAGDQEFFGHSSPPSVPARAHQPHLDPADQTRQGLRPCRSTAPMRATGALTPRVLVQRLDATLGGRNLGLGIVDRRFGQLGDPISGCDCV